MTHEKAITIAQLIIDNDNVKAKNELLENDLIHAEMNLRVMTDKYTQTMELLKLAVEDLKTVAQNNVICDCTCCGFLTEKCDNCEDLECWQWQHADRMEAAEANMSEREA